MAGWGISETWCGWGKRGWSQVFLLPTVISGGGSVLPMWAAPSGHSAFSREFLCCSNLGKFPVTCSFGEFLCSLAAPRSCRHHGLLEMVFQGGWLVMAAAGSRKGWWPAASHGGRVFMQKCHSSVFQERQMAPCRIWEENMKIFLLYMIINLKWPKEKVLSTHKNVWLTEKPQRHQHFTGLYRGCVLAKELASFYALPHQSKLIWDLWDWLQRW